MNQWEKKKKKNKKGSVNFSNIRASVAKKSEPHIPHNLLGTEKEEERGERNMMIICGISGGVWFLPHTHTHLMTSEIVLFWKKRGIFQSIPFK